ncbi:MAG: tail fiber domain-containing protein [bacterium]
MNNKQVMVRWLGTFLVAVSLAIGGIRGNCRAEEAPSQEPVTITKRLSAGWNLISLEVSPTAFQDVEGMCKDINAQGGGCVEIDGWIGGNWSRYICGYLENNFAVQEGSFYFIKCEMPSEWKVSGIVNPISSSNQVSSSASGYESTGESESPGTLEGVELPYGSLGPLLTQDGTLSEIPDSLTPGSITFSLTSKDAACGWLRTSPRVYLHTGTDNVGIGTPNPVRKLDVIGNSSTSPGTGTLTSSGTTVTGAGTSFTTQLHIGDIIIVGTQQRMVKRINSNTSLTTSTAFNPPLTSSTFSYQQPIASIRKSGAAPSILVNSVGNVGVSTSLPEKKLHVSGGDYDGILLDNTEDLYWKSTAGTAVPVLTMHSDNDVYLDATADVTSSDLKFRAGTNANVDMVITPNGNVGIGTTNPEAKLHLAGTNPEIRIDNTAASTSKMRLISYTGGDTWIQAGTTWNTGSVAPIRFSGIGGTPVRMSILGNGNVGIGTTGPGYKLEVNGSAGKPGGGSWSDSSDARLKKNVQNLTGALDRLTKLQGVTFEWINPGEHGNQSDAQAGLIAQEVEKVFPEWVSEVEPIGKDKDLAKGGEKVKSLQFPHGFNAYLIEAIKELKAQNEALKAKDEAKQAQIEALQARIEALESR